MPVAATPLLERKKRAASAAAEEQVAQTVESIVGEEHATEHNVPSTNVEEDVSVANIEKENESETENDVVVAVDEQQRNSEDAAASEAEDTSEDAAASEAEDAVEDAGVEDGVGEDAGKPTAKTPKAMSGSGRVRVSICLCFFSSRATAMGPFRTLFFCVWVGRRVCGAGRGIDVQHGCLLFWRRKVQEMFSRVKCTISGEAS